MSSGRTRWPRPTPSAAWLAVVALATIALGSPAGADRNPNYNNDVYMVNDDGSAMTRLTDTPGKENDVPDWAPDGRLAFSSNRTGDYDIYVGAIGDPNPKRLTTTPGYDSTPAWS
ncbi:MAG: hypothetical protein LC792_22215, partial [Actinobacteria bacterium]|nr:hypothetical protein [Actinomycetota bacterium]